MLRVWLKKDFISKQIYYFLHFSDSLLPKAYGLPKIHKTNHPFRIIISSINTAHHPLASFLQKIISNSVTYSEKYI